MMWMCHSLFNHSSVEGNLGWFQFLVPASQAAVDIHMHRSGSGKPNVGVIYGNKIRVIRVVA